ncbi:uncharacterized protein LOC127618592 [Xyrauchen texanus]|uniref:uncharacterized protein LOC127618592 n=1 Tax=Xyrauchen texanus TaxID=154827 RepID=UPI002242B1A4|nr:uncharacterized protein LOC127618592 [Xyrauchen texanus]XP_051947110.1 uncharacterized protein LOC127618592 [Xyrauchen texanus]XP_051947111.1 uncharacterized protein LOC127618592 [Xyrauchen texanus]
MFIMREQVDVICCKSVGTDLSMLDIDEFITEISQLKKEVTSLKTKLMERDDRLQELEKGSCQSSVCVTDGTSTECQDSVWSGRDQSTPQRLLDKLSEQRSRDTQDSQLTLLCSTDGNQGDQTSTESLTSVCNAGEQQMLQIPVKIEVKQEEIKEENTAEEQQGDKDDDDQIATESQTSVCNAGEQQMLQIPVKIEVNQEEIKEDEQQSNENYKYDDQTFTESHTSVCNTREQQMLQTPVKMKMCSVKLLDCRNLMKMRGEIKVEEQQSDDDDDDDVQTSTEPLTSVSNTGEQQMLQTPVEIEENTVEEQQRDDEDDISSANRKKAEARLTGGDPPPPPLTPSEELALSLNKGRPVVDGIPEGTSSDFATSHNNSSDLVQFADGRIVLLDPPETTQSVTINGDEETTSAVTELESAGRPTENLAGDVHADEGPSTSTHNLTSLSAKEVYKLHLLRQIKKTDMDMDLKQLQLEEKRLAIKKAKLEIELEHRLKDMKK